MSSTTTKVTTGVLVGGVVGAAAAMLLTPKSGKEMRQRLAHQTANLKDKTIELKDEAVLQTKLGTMAGKEKASNLVGSVKDKAAGVSNQAKEKVSAMMSSSSTNE
ncbi:hypothetical protein A374_05126 [Fictibacillus macauensis ZFHKF-1]|uniref:General stress protein n=1 Tax=Fictibacillus macauensis ZFHKF-1 TaxID=1196324 RepID=I8AL37_9BACL|nr:YtxH domain-containing protein [Fictibacillus macauensis]EIT86319.1 hypothetical protein A374_05126 [Fictibacillus macauensis ZFHKF-1]